MLSKVVDKRSAKCTEHTHPDVTACAIPKACIFQARPIPFFLVLADELRNLSLEKSLHSRGEFKEFADVMEEY